MSKTIVRRETRFSVHLPRKEYREDAHYVKEQVFYSDGTSAPRTFLVKDFVRSVWVTKEAFRNHKEKKEFEHMENLIEIKTTQSDVNRAIAGMLGMPHLAKRPDEIRNSPYVYGYDQTSTSIIKLKSLLKNNFVQSPYTVAAFDIETDIETREILIATVATLEKVYITVLKRYLQGKGNALDSVNAGIRSYLGAMLTVWRLFNGN